LLVVARDGRSVDIPSLMTLYEEQVPEWWLPAAVVVGKSLQHDVKGELVKLGVTEMYLRYLFFGKSLLPSIYGWGHAKDRAK
jgi:hypothetical protein